MEMESSRAARVTSGSASTRTRASLPDAIRPRSISSTLPSISSVPKSGISATAAPGHTWSPTLNGAHDLLLGGLQARFLDIVTRGRKVALVLFGGDQGVRLRLLERGLRLLQGRVFFLKLLFGGGRVEANDGIARFDRATGGRLP